MRRRWSLVAAFLACALLAVPWRAQAAWPMAWPTVYLAGERRADYPFLPVYGQGGWLNINLWGVSREGAPGLYPSFQRWGPAGWEPAELTAFDPGDFIAESGGAVAIRQRLVGSDGRPLPVGFYRVEIRATSESTGALLSAQDFVVIFSPTNADQRQAREWDDWHLLSPLLPVVTVGSYGRALSTWRLDIQHPWVFIWALQIVSGLSDPLQGAERLARAATTAVDGYWPALPDVGGSVPATAPPADPWPQSNEYMSVLTWLAGNDRRGQCYDYTAVTVALLRAVGLPSRAVTVVDPLPMPHPYDAEREVQWAYHVWAEVSGDQGWLALDPTYMDAAAGISDRNPGLQPGTGPWFRAMIGPESQVLRADGFWVSDAYADYLSEDAWAVQSP